MTYRDFEISKKNGVRKISAPDNELKAKLKSFLPMLNRALAAEELVFNAQNIIHGFRKNHGVKTAVRPHLGFDTTLSMDISNFFNSVFYEKHLKLTRYISHRDVAQYMLHKEGYTPQGFNTSPMLANIAIVPVVKRIENNLAKMFGRGNFAFTVYADDINISTNIPDIDIQIFHIAKMVEEELNSAGFEINKSKTRVRYAKYGYRRILGVMVGTDEMLPTRQLRRKLRAAKHQSNGHSIGGLQAWTNYVKSIVIPEM